MATSFNGFSEEDLKRIKSNDSGAAGANNGLEENSPTVAKKVAKLGLKSKRTPPPYKLQLSADNDDVDVSFEKCQLSLKSPNDTINNNNNEEENELSIDKVVAEINELNTENTYTGDSTIIEESLNQNSIVTQSQYELKNDNYTENEITAHKAKLEDLQLRQKLMEEQNKKRKEMLAKALADRTKQTEEEVLRLEKIKKELAVLDGQFSVDVAVLRKKIDQACHSFSDAEKNYLRVEKDFLNAKIQLQKEREKKELLIEHLCALITHNETRKAQKLETLMFQLANDCKDDDDINRKSIDDDKPVIVDGVDERTGKMVELENL